MDDADADACWRNRFDFSLGYWPSRIGLGAEDGCLGSEVLAEAVEKNARNILRMVGV